MNPDSKVFHASSTANIRENKFSISKNKNTQTSFNLKISIKANKILIYEIF